MKLEIKQIQFNSPEYFLEVQLRSKILREPLGLKFSPQELNRDASDIHLCAFSEGKLVGCLILSPQPDKVLKMRQVAVDSSAQGLGVGGALVKASEDISLKMGLSEIHLNARETAVKFYLSQGYEIYGEPFEEVTIPHRKMRKTL